MSKGLLGVSAALVLVAFVFLLLATISTPVVTSFSLAQTTDFSYGIFGYCDADGSNCSGASYPYSVSASDSATNWLLSSSTTRDTLAKIFIVAPIALGFNFITFVLTIVAMFTPRPVLVGALVSNVISLITSLLVAIIVIIVFYPNIKWTGWILIGSASADLSALGLLISALSFAPRVVHDDSDVSLSDLTRFDTDGEKINGFSTSFGGPAPPQSNFNNNLDRNAYDNSSEFTKNSKNSQPQKTFGTGSTFNSGFTHVPSNNFQGQQRPPNFANGSSTGSGSVVAGTFGNGSAGSFANTAAGPAAGPFANARQPPQQYPQPGIQPRTSNFGQQPVNVNGAAIRGPNGPNGPNGNSALYHAKPQQANDFTMNQGSVYASSSYYDPEPRRSSDRISLVNSVNSPIQIKTQMAPVLVANSATPSGPLPTSPLASKSVNPNLPYPPQHSIRDSSISTIAGPSNFPHQSVFEHHPEVEGHKPFTELDDFEFEQDERSPLTNEGKHDDSDTDSDFTSVSQRAINPNYNPQPHQQHQQHYPVPQNQQFQQQPFQPQQFQPQQFLHPQQQQQYQPLPHVQQRYSQEPIQQQRYSQEPQRYTEQRRYSQEHAHAPPAVKSVSEAVLSNNPDFNLAGLGAKRNQKGVVNKNAAAGALMGRR